MVAEGPEVWAAMCELCVWDLEGVKSELIL